MELGFDTIGNATLIVYDRGPLLVTDPWFVGDAYFGSWTRSHEVPAEQEAAIRGARFIWVSHGHPDHLSWASMEQLSGADVLVPAHRGGRIAAALEGSGHRVTVLADRCWTRLSDRVRICSVADYNQDALLLVDIDGTLVVNLNDATDHGWRRFVRREVRRHPRSYLLQLSGWGDADMINLFDGDGQRIPPLAASREPVGAQVGIDMRRLGTRFFVPFSSMHRYQRSDSVWANEFTTPTTAHADGFPANAGEVLPAFVRVDCRGDNVTPLTPAPREVVPLDPALFGDNWSDTLDDDEVTAARLYFGQVDHLVTHFARIALRVGGEEHTVVEGEGRVGLTFEAPRASLMTCIRQQIFDDLLIGNFARTYVDGPPDPSALYPHFTPWVAKYADNGMARTQSEIDVYMHAYRHRAPVDFVRHRLERGALDVARRVLPRGTVSYRVARRAYRRFSAAGDLFARGR